jgi:chemotaxis protein MotB
LPKPRPTESSPPPEPEPDGGIPQFEEPAPLRQGSWKVAYADFATALMALFIVLWILNSGEKVRQSVGGYFQNPLAFTRRIEAAQTGVLPAPQSDVSETQRRIEQALARMPGFQAIRNNVKLSVTAEGLRIDLLETEQGLFFTEGSPAPTEAGQGLLKLLAGELSKLPNAIVIEGHTDARPYRGVTPSEGYGNWELAVERANAARRLLHSFGVPAEQVAEVRGFADRRLLDSEHPSDARNRRISVVVRFIAATSE